MVVCLLRVWPHFTPSQHGLKHIQTHHPKSDTGLSESDTGVQWTTLKSQQEEVQVSEEFYRDSADGNSRL